MTQKVGVFEKQGHAVEAIELLKEQGFSSDKIRIVARNEDHASRVESETDVSVEKIEDQDRNSHRYAEPVSGLNIPVLPLAAASPMYLGDSMGNAMGNANTWPAVPYPGVALVDPIDGDSRQTLRDLGFNESDSEKYSDYLEKGHLLLLVESEPSEEMTAEAALRNSGASVVH